MDLFNLKQQKNKEGAVLSFLTEAILAERKAEQLEEGNIIELEVGEKKFKNVFKPLFYTGLWLSHWNGERRRICFFFNPIPDDSEKIFTPGEIWEGKVTNISSTGGKTKDGREIIEVWMDDLKRKEDTIIHIDKENSKIIRAILSGNVEVKTETIKVQIFNNPFLLNRSKNERKEVCGIQTVKDLAGEIIFQKVIFRVEKTEWLNHERARIGKSLGGVPERILKKMPELLPDHPLYKEACECFRPLL